MDHFTLLNKGGSCNVASPAQDSEGLSAVGPHDDAVRCLDIGVGSLLVLCANLDLRVRVL
jgi:hypothetical protein